MKTVTVLALMLFAIRAPSQTAAQLSSHARCRFSDGNSITVTYSAEHQQFRFSTDGILFTSEGWKVPSGDYTAYPEKEYGHWSLKMTRPVKQKEDTLFLSLPMSVDSIFQLPRDQAKISFDQTGGSCVMHLREKPDTVLSLVLVQPESRVRSST